MFSICCLSLNYRCFSCNYLLSWQLTNTLLDFSFSVKSFPFLPHFVSCHWLKHMPSIAFSGNKAYLLFGGKFLFLFCIASPSARQMVVKAIGLFVIFLLEEAPPRYLLGEKVKEIPFIMLSLCPTAHSCYYIAIRFTFLLHQFFKNIIFTKK